MFFSMFHQNTFYNGCFWWQWKKNLTSEKMFILKIKVDFPEKYIVNEKSKVILTLCKTE